VCRERAKLKWRLCVCILCECGVYVLCMLCDVVFILWDVVCMFGAVVVCFACVFFV